MTNPSTVQEPVSPTTVTYDAEVGPQAEGELARKREDAPDAMPTTTDESKDLEEEVFAEDDQDKEENDDILGQEPCDENVQPVRTGPSPVKPSAEEVEAHRITHYPFRSWCQWCVWGKALGEQRHASTHEHTIAIIGVDYFYLTGSDIVNRSEIDEDDATLEAMRQRNEVVKAVIIRCYMSKSIFAYTIPCKGPDEDGFVVGLITAAITWMGHTRLIMKADNERSLQSLVTASLRAMRVEVQDLEQAGREAPTEYNSQSNGGTEVGIRNVRKDFRTMKLCLESRIGYKVPICHPVCSWLLQHVAFLQTALVRADDGFTAWMKVRGRPFSQRLYGFGEQIHWKRPLKGPRHAPHGNSGSNWGTGTYVGHDKASNAYIIVSDKEGVVHSHAIQRRPMDERWSKASIESIAATPWSLRERRETEVRFVEPTDKVETDVRELLSTLRRMRLVREDFEAHGYMEGCGQCQYIMETGKTRPGVAHSERCRARMLAEIGKTPEGQLRLAAQEAHGVLLPIAGRPYRGRMIAGLRRGSRPPHGR